MYIQINIIFSLIISFLISFLIIPKIIKISVTKKLFDEPNHRSATKYVVPTLGGIAIYAGFRIAQVLSLDNYNIDQLKYLNISVLILFFVGMLDDIVGVEAKKKLLIQLMVAFYLVFLGNIYITSLHGILGIYEIGYVSSAIISIIIIVGIINALNLIDGIDGLSSGLGILISITYGTWFLYAGNIVYALTAYSLTGSLIAFFIFNVFGKSNKIFMGDTGSLILGAIFAVLTIEFNEIAGSVPVALHGLPAISLAIMLYPVIDTCRVIAIRLYNRRSPFSPDMNHIHHQFLKITKNHLKASLIIISGNAVIIIASFFLIDKIGNNYLFFLLLILGFILASIPVIMNRLSSNQTDDIKTSNSVFAFYTFFKKLVD